MTYSLGILNWVFLVTAILGGSIFLVRVILLIAGLGDHGADAPDGADADLDADHADGHDAHHGEQDRTTDSSFRMLSLQGVMAFFLMFGTLGFVLNRIIGSGPLLAVAGGAAAGLLTMFLTAKLLQSLLKLQSDGNIRIQNAIGATGTVYLRIPSGGTGRVQVVVQGRLTEFDADSASGGELDTGTGIRVTAVRGQILTVEKQ